MRSLETTWGMIRRVGVGWLDSPVCPSDADSPRNSLSDSPFTFPFRQQTLAKAKPMRGCCESLCNPHKNSRIRLKLREMTLSLAS